MLLMHANQWNRSRVEDQWFEDSDAVSRAEGADLKARDSRALLHSMEGAAAIAIT